MHVVMRYFCFRLPCSSCAIGMHPIGANERKLVPRDVAALAVPESGQFAPTALKSVDMFHMAEGRLCHINLVRSARWQEVKGSLTDTYAQQLS